MRSSVAICYFIFAFINVYFTVLAQELSFTEKPITIAINKTSYPYHFIDEQGQAAGLMIDYWNLWAKKQQVDIEFVPLDWSETLDRVGDHQLDIHAGLSPTEHRRTFLDFSSSFFTHHRYIFVHRDLVEIKTLAQLEPYTIGVIKNSSQIDDLDKLAPSLKLRRYDSGSAMYQAALDNKILAFADLEKLANHPHLNKLRVAFPYYKRILLESSDYVSAVGKNNASLLAFVEQGLAKITDQEKAEIERKWMGVDKQTDELVLAFTPELPPYMSVSASTGKAQGLFIDIWRLWSEKTGQKVVFIAEEMANVVELINNKKVDIHVAYPESASSKTGLEVAKHLYTVNSYVYVSQHFPNVTRMADLAGKTVGLFLTAPYRQQVISTYPQLKFRAYTHYSEMFDAVELGEIDALIGSSENTDANLRNNNLQSSFYRLNFPSFQSKINSLVAPDNLELVSKIQAGFDQITPEELIELEHRWINDPQTGYFQFMDKKIKLSEQEINWIAAHPDIKMGIVKQWAPIEFVDDKGLVNGVNSDVLNLISQRTNLHFDYHLFESWGELYQALLNNKIDMLGSATVTEERKSKLLFSHSYWEMPWVVIHQRKFEQQLTLKDFYGKQLAIIKDYQFASELTQNHPRITLKYVNDIEEGLLAVQTGKVDGFVENLATASVLLKRESLITLMLSVVDTVNVDNNHFAIRKDWPELNSIVDKSLASISPSEKQTIYNKWFEVNVETGLDKNVVLRISAQIGIIILIVLAIIVIWNRRLFAEVKVRKQLEEKMKHMATHDELTGLANRNLLKDRLLNAISFHKRHKLKIAVLFIDLDGFKNINDTYGHDVGDELLIQLAKQLSECVRQSDTVVRFGGDEFVLLLTGLHRNVEAAFIADKVLNIMKTPFKLSIGNASVSCSIGISIYPDDGDTDSELIKVADTLMYRVKSQGKNHYVFNAPTQ